MKKSWKQILIVSAALFVIINVVYFLIPVEHTAVFWVADIFAILAVGGLFATYLLAFPKGQNMTEKVFSTPVIFVGIRYLTVQLLISTVFVVLSKFAPLWLELILCIAWLAIFIILLVGAVSQRDTVVRMEQSHQEQQAFIRNLTSGMSAFAETVQDADIRKAARAFAEQLRYSDPVSSAETMQIENQLSAKVDAMKQAVRNGDKEEGLRLLEELSGDLILRNQLCAQTKKRGTDRGSL